MGHAPVTLGGQGAPRPMAESGPEKVEEEEPQQEEKEEEEVVVEEEEQPMPK